MSALKWMIRKRRESLFRRYQTRLNKLPFLASVDRDSGGTISSALADEALLFDKARLFSGALIVALTVVGTLEGLLIVGVVLPLLLLGAVYVIAFGYILILRPRARYWRLIYSMFELTENVETHPGKWRDPNFRGTVNLSIESVARRLDHVWQQLRPSDIQTTVQLRKASSSAANSLRELKIWVAKPGPLTYTDLTYRLSSDFTTVLEGRWYDLPNSALPTFDGRPLVRKSLFLFAAVAAIAVSVFLAVQDKGLAKGASPFVGIVGVLFLQAGGISVASAGQAADTFTKVKP